MPKQPLDWDARVVRRDLFRIANVSLYTAVYVTIIHHCSMQFTAYVHRDGSSKRTRNLSKAMANFISPGYIRP